MTEDGTMPGALAGSGLTLDKAMRNAMKLLPVSLPEAVRMASTNPARIAGFGERKGQIKVGFDADLVLLDKRHVVKRTWVGGELRFESD